MHTLIFALVLLLSGCAQVLPQAFDAGVTDANDADVGGSVD